MKYLWLLFISINCFAKQPASYDDARFIKLTKSKQVFIVVDIAKQKLYIFKGTKAFMKFSVSTSKFGIGSKSGSKKTPLGLHFVHTKVGDKIPQGGIFVKRKYTGKVAKIIKEKKDTNADLVTTRILWLRGKEKGKNVGKGHDSFNRAIYIHGTPEEGLIGTPASFGCIRMRNNEVIHLYKKAYTGMPVLIL